MIEKLLHFSAKDDPGFVARGLFGPNGLLEMEKTAGHHPFDDWDTGDELRKFLRTVTPRDREENCYTLVNALGAGEYYGSNINADYFPWDALCHEGQDYGHQTFLNAYAYQHHVNKDPSKAMGKVVLSLLNPRMKRVELVIKLNREKARLEGGDGIITRIDNGEFPDVSMGCKVPFDVCSICGHKSKTRADYCFPPGTPILMASGQIKAIEEVLVDDDVVTHTGEVRKVTHLLPSTTKNGLVVVEAFGFGTISSTPNHPFLVSRLRTGVHGGRQAQLDGIPPSWVNAEDLKKNDTVFLPVPPITGSRPNSSSVGRLLGLYLAEGSPVFSSGVSTPKGVSFTFHSKETHLVQHVLDSINELSPSTDTSWNEYKYPNHNAVTVRVNSKDVGSWLLLHGGRGSHGKCLNPAVWSFGVPFARAVLHGWAEGDGSYDAKTRTMRVATSSETLARQMQLLAAACGVLSGIKLHKRDTNFGHQEIWYITFSGDAAKAILEERPQRIFEKQSKLFFHDNYLCSTIKEVSRRSYEGPVYNFEVEDDHSYVAGCYAVHNCEHMRPPPEKRGVYGPNKILPDGRRVYVINTLPRFFDISFVFIGADKTAKVMAKIASKQDGQVCMGPVCSLPGQSPKSNPVSTHPEGRVNQKELDVVYAMMTPRFDKWRDSAKYGDKYKLPHGITFVKHEDEDHEDAIIEQQLLTKVLKKTASMHYDQEGTLCGPCGGQCHECGKKSSCHMDKLSEAFKTSSHHKVSEILKSIPANQFSMKRLKDIEGCEPDIPRDILDEMAGYGLGPITGGLGTAGIVLKPKEFQRIVLVRMGEDDLADHLDDHGMVFNPSPTINGLHDVHPGRHGFMDILDLIKNLIRGRTAFGAPFRMRVVVSRPLHKSLPTHMGVDNPLLDKISSAYNGYRRSLLMKMSQAAKIVENDPGLREMVLGDSLMGAAIKTASNNTILSRDSVAYFLGAHMADRSLFTNPADALAVAESNQELLSELAAQGY